jgi:hypothetical protein
MSNEADSIYVTVLDFLVPETVEYEFIDDEVFDELSNGDIEDFLKNKGHVIKDITYMVHRNSIKKVQIDGSED